MKAFFSKIWSWILANKIIAIIIAAVLVVGVTCAIVLPIALGKDNKNKIAQTDDVTENDTNSEAEDSTGDQNAVCAHVYDNACDTTCNTCGTTREITHAHSNTLTAGDATHYYACTVCGNKKDEAAHSFIIETANDSTLKAEATSTNKAQYWKSCVCGKISTAEYFESDKFATTLEATMTGKTYDGTAVAAPTYTTNSTGAISIEWYNGNEKLPAAPSNAGIYTVKVIVAETDAYAGASVTKEFTITKAASALSNLAISPVEIKYGDSYSVNYSLTGDGDVTVDYKVKDADDSTYTTTVPTDTGDYTLRITVADGANYLGCSETFDFEIKPITLAGLNVEREYNGGTVYDIDLDSEGYSGVTVRITFDSKNVGAGVLGMEILENGESSNNYTIDVSTCNVNVVQKAVGLMWTAPESLRFDGEEKIPVAALTGVIFGDTCTADIEKMGDNVWFGESFTYRAILLTGADAENYKLPDNVESPVYTITIDESVSVGEEADVGSVWWVDNVLPYTMYYSIDLQCGYYYFDYVSDNQGVSFVFELYAKGDTATPIATYEVDENSTTSVAFKIETDGVYYVKVVSTDEGQYETLTIKQDTHESKDAYGFCAHGCGEYLGEDLDTNSWETVTLGGDNSKTAYYRFEDGGDYLYSLKYLQGDNENMTVKCYRTDNNGDFVEVTLGGSLISSFDDYYYLTFRLNAIGSGATKTFIFQVEQTLF